MADRYASSWSPHALAVKEVALNPENLTMTDILAAATAARAEHKEAKEKK